MRRLAAFFLIPRQIGGGVDCKTVMVRLKPYGHRCFIVPQRRLGRTALQFSYPGDRHRITNLLSSLIQDESIPHETSNPNVET